VIEVYRLHSGRYPANNSKGSAINGGRWNPKGIEVIYTSASRSLAVVEILVHYSVLPSDFLMTPIIVPDGVSILEVPETVLTPGWDHPTPLPTTQEYGERWVSSSSSAVLRVPSAIIALERNYVINVLHPQFHEITFGRGEPFRFDSRLRP
jgi:RES domain-containing protein